MEHVNPEVPDEDRLEETAVAEDSAATAAHQHDDERVDEWEEESFPASDPPSNY
ncbi:hypothetical protein [Microbacterium sp. A93]|uniref:hypothetical protein n=1 Tax=Microbacterium sp. A93 TaxID=3450716 RepID=UPI003F43F961